MSVMGRQKRKCRPVSSMSASPPKADIAEHGCHVRLVPITEVGGFRSITSFGNSEHSRQDGRAERLGGLKVERQLVLERLLHR
jgi:hypothetical protein